MEWAMVVIINLLIYTIGYAIVAESDDFGWLTPYDDDIIRHVARQ